MRGHPIFQTEAEQEARDLCRELLSQPPAARRPALEREERFQRPEVARCLVEVSEDRIFDDPSEALDLARLAGAICQPRTEGGDGEVAVAALLQTANALRVKGQLAEAEQVFAGAREHLEHLGPQPALEARRLELEASLYTDQRRFPEALDRIEEALRLHRSTGDRTRECRALVQKGHILLSLETRPAAALRAFHQALPLLEPDRDLRLLVICVHNLILGLNRLGYAIAARSLLADLKALHTRLGDDVSTLKLRWLEGQLDLELGKLAGAERAYQEARQGFLERDLPYHAALVSLDLAELYLTESRAYKLRELAVGLLPVFQSRKLHREALAALIVFREAVAVEAADRALIGEVASFLRQVQHNPRLRFRRRSRRLA